MEEKGTHALEVGPEAHATEAPQDKTTEDLVYLPFCLHKLKIIIKKNLTT